MVDAIQGGGAAITSSASAPSAQQASQASNENEEAVRQGRSVSDDTRLSAEAVQALEESDEAQQPLAGFTQSATPAGQSLDITV